MIPLFRVLGPESFDECNPVGQLAKLVCIQQKDNFIKKKKSVTQSTDESLNGNKFSLFNLEQRKEEYEAADDDTL